MSSKHSTPVLKPPKPRPDFPLFSHASGKWAKKIKGRIIYFGKWEDPDGAEAEYDATVDLIKRGLARELAGTSITLKSIVNEFLNAKRLKVIAGDMSRRSHEDYKGTCGRLLEFFGKGTPLLSLSSTDWLTYRAEIAKRRGPVALGNEVQRIRTLGKWAKEAGFIATEVPFGPDFKRPNKVTLRRHEQSTGKKLFTPEQILLLADDVGIHLRAMVMLGINCGFGNSDVGQLTIEAVDLENGWVTFPRPKTAIERRCPLWPETIDAMRKSFARRHAPKDREADGLFFITPYGKSWHKEVAENPITKSITAALMRLGIHKAGMGFYWLRHTHETISSQAADQVATNFVMGHADPHISETYRHEVWDPRLRRVVESVRTWLYAEPSGEGGTE